MDKKTSFQEADDLKDSRDKEFLERWEQYKENGRKKNVRDVLYKSFEMLNEDEQPDLGECKECGKSWYFCICSSQTENI